MNEFMKYAPKKIESYDVTYQQTDLKCLIDRLQTVNTPKSEILRKLNKDIDSQLFDKMINTNQPNNGGSDYNEQVVSEKAIEWLWKYHPEVYDGFYKRIDDYANEGVIKFVPHMTSKTHSPYLSCVILPDAAKFIKTGSV